MARHIKRVGGQNDSNMYTNPKTVKEKDKKNLNVYKVFKKLRQEATRRKQTRSRRSYGVRGIRSI
jgi:hypothetical protein